MVFRVQNFVAKNPTVDIRQIGVKLGDQFPH